MKASIKFRDEQKPLLRAKIPLNIVSFPFQSAVAAGESKELALSLSTFLDSGPSIKFSYRPNDSQKPFAFVFKTGIGHFGSPHRSPLIMSAEFNLIGTQNPSFFIHFKPNLGDFFVKKSQSSSGFPKKLNGGIDNEGFNSNGYFNMTNGFSPATVDGLVKGMELGATTTVPLRDFASVNFRWGLKFPEAAESADMVMVGRKADVAGGDFFGRSYNYRLPYLVMNKIGIEHGIIAKEKVEKDDSKAKLGDAAEAYLEVKKQIDAIRGENATLGKALSDLRTDLGVKNAESLSLEWAKGSKNSGDMKSAGAIGSS